MLLFTKMICLSLHFVTSFLSTVLTGHLQSKLDVKDNFMKFEDLTIFFKAFTFCSLIQPLKS